MTALLRPLERDSETSLADAVYQSLLEAIVSGQLPHGTVLSEVEVAKALDVSRTPVHDALRNLARDGLVEHSSGRRARVSRFTRDDMFEIFEMRKYLEIPAAGLAAGRMDRRQLVPLRERLTAMAALPDSEDWPIRWSPVDEQFHRMIAEASGNRRLARDISRYRLLHRGFNRIGTNYACLQEAVAEHHRILDALEAHDQARARAAMEAHIRSWQDYFMELFDKAS